MFKIKRKEKRKRRRRKKKKKKHKKQEIFKKEELWKVTEKGTIRREMGKEEKRTGWEKKWKTEGRWIGKHHNAAI